MTFGPNHYVPVLKVKRGEKAALRSLAPALRTSITPLLEIVERKPDKAATLTKHLDTAFKDLATSTAGFGRVFLDTREIAPDGPGASQEVFQRASSASIPFVPVTGINRTADLLAALGNRSHGFALRITREEFETGTVSSGIQAFLSRHRLSADQIDLIVDLGPVEDMVSDGVMNLTEMFLAALPDLTHWRTLTVSGCAFPLSMGIVDTNSAAVVERAEWVAWRDGLYANRSRIRRLPTYSDCGIQHPKGVEDFDPRIMAASAAVRYAHLDQWLLIKGESTRKTPPSEQFPQLATQLVYGHLTSYFDGVVHCAGCTSMRDAADGAPSLGSPEAWRRLGTIHHLTTVIGGLAALPWP